MQANEKSNIVNDRRKKMVTYCPHCKEELRLALTGRFIDRVNPALADMYLEELERMKRRAAVQGGFFGGMASLGIDMAKGMSGMMVKMYQGMVEHPPMVTVIKCVNCNVALDVRFMEANRSN